MTTDVLIRAFKKEGVMGKRVFDCTVDKIAGYYLYHYSKDPLSFVSKDIKEMNISLMKGEQVILFIKACLKLGNV